MSLQKKKRKYNSKNRQEKSKETQLKILNSAKALFSKHGIKNTTIEQIATKAKVSTPTIYALFKNKSEIIGRLGQTFVFGDKYKSLVVESMNQKDPRLSLKMAPQITLAIFLMEMEQMSFLWDSSYSSPEIEILKQKLEEQRFERQKFIIERLLHGGFLNPTLNIDDARDILWTLTGREVFKKLVLEKEWPHSQFQSWLENSLIRLLLA